MKNKLFKVAPIILAVSQNMVTKESDIGGRGGAIKSRRGSGVGLTPEYGEEKKHR